MTNTFAIILKTNPENDKGIPYIIERLTMSGSEKHPTKDAF